MEQPRTQTFLAAAESDLSAVRSTLLIVAQTGDAADLGAAAGALRALHDRAASAGMTDLVSVCRECEDTIRLLASDHNVSPGAAYAALDIVARIEALIWNAPLQSGEFISDVAGFVDDSFDKLLPRAEIIDEQPERFEIDEETFDVFRSEADDILSNIAGNLSLLSIAPDDQRALWEVRRSAHTLKGAAGIVGLRSAAETAHRMEDLLDRIVELRSSADSNVIEFLVASARRLNAICAARLADDEDESLDAKYNLALASLTPSEDLTPNAAQHPGMSTAAPAASPDPVKATTTPIVRVSLDRLDELIKLSNSLTINRAAIAERFTELELLSDNPDTEAFARLEGLMEAQRALAEQIKAKLLRIRMVKFGTLETRLSRNVNVTSTDEGKKAILVIENGDVEVDTQMIDAVIEPLLHLLKNAVVHGIESPETRRLIGKPERGRINVSVNADEEFVRIAVTDDGAGISAAKLRDRAVSAGIITAHQADSMNDREAMRLIFGRGLTTAENISLNAGRGVGMSIVKEAVEARGGEVHFDSYPQRGTTFTITMPVRPVRVEPPPAQADETTTVKSRTEPLVLIVDDSSSIRRQAARLTEEAGFRVITANNGAEALELLLNGEWEPDLIMSDVEMPQIDGWEFLEYVKTDKNFGHIPVVMVTSLDAEKHRQRAFELGADDYLIKPLKAADIHRLAGPLIRTSDLSEPEACLA
jgi:two-component system chemotaxis sensor kinase CheA